MPQYTSLRIITAQLPEQIQKCTPLGISTSISGKAVLVQPALIANTDTQVVPSGGMRPNLVGRPAAMQLPVAGDVEMIANVSEPPCLMRAS